MKQFLLFFFAFLYRWLLRPVLFLSNSETIHEKLTLLVQKIGDNTVVRTTLHCLFVNTNQLLQQTIAGVQFDNPIGLAAGFDYEAKLTQILPTIGFGYGTIGTITNIPYAGNHKPRLGRLIQSRSLMVNKGFKNSGMRSILKKLRHISFTYPVGLSIGRTNIPFETRQEAIDDIVSAFSQAEMSGIHFAYYELNISCPNLNDSISFYAPPALKQLLTSLKKLQVTKPIFVKLPISQTNDEIIDMLSVIVQFPIAGVIIGNLQTNRSDPSFNRDELWKYPRGNFSGKPTEKRSNELIALAYKHFGKRLIIIGCGGIFSAQDAYTKIKLGASLVQLITGLIYQGPQLVAQINEELPRLLKKDGYTHISEAIGKKGLQVTK